MISSRTPEGEPDRCPVCRKRLRLSPSSPGRDAPCPRCGTLVWFAPGHPSRRPGQPSDASRRTAAGTPARAGSTGGGDAPAAAFTLDDFRRQIGEIAGAGMADVLDRLPGVGEMVPDGVDPVSALKRVRGVIDAMTAAERRDPGTIDRARRRRIAAGAGVRPGEVDRLLRQFGRVQGLMSQMSGMTLWQRIKLVAGIGRPNRWIVPGAGAGKAGATP